MEGNNNLWIYEALREVPENAKKEIAGGKLKGKTDINPMWRIKALTEVFGPHGTGWVCTIKKLWTEPGAGGEVTAWVLCELKYKTQDGSWSEPVQGIGGSMLVQTEREKLVTNDEAYKMAYTDAISVAAKGLGAGASVYWDKDPTKYGTAPSAKDRLVTEETLRELETQLQSVGKDMEWALEYLKKKCSYQISGPKDLEERHAKQMIKTLMQRQKGE